MQAFLYLKWEQIKQIYHFITIFCHLVYSVVYTSYCLLMFVVLCQPPEDDQKRRKAEKLDKYESVNCTLSEIENQATVEFAKWLWIALLLFTLLYASYEALNFKINIKRYWES